MDSFLNTFLEILKYSIPALIVFFTIYYILRKYLDQQYNLEVLKFKKEEMKNVLPLKLQAYERLALFLERISPEQLIYRLNGPQMTAKDLRTALIIAVQKEYEHNLTQQIYVSDNLWKIIALAKDEILGLVGGIPADDGSSQDFSNLLLSAYGQLKLNPIMQAQSAIKKETELILK